MVSFIRWDNLTVVCKLGVNQKGQFRLCVFKRAQFSLIHLEQICQHFKIAAINIWQPKCFSLKWQSVFRFMPLEMALCTNNTEYQQLKSCLLQANLNINTWCKTLIKPIAVRINEKSRGRRGKVKMKNIQMNSLAPYRRVLWTISSRAHSIKEQNSLGTWVGMLSNKTWKNKSQQSSYEFFIKS